MSGLKSIAVAAASVLAVGFAAGSAQAACTMKAGSATGPTRGFAEYESELIIRQVTGNWPIQTDKISKPKYTCKESGGLWTCKAVAKVCKG